MAGEPRAETLEFLDDGGRIAAQLTLYAPGTPNGALARLSEAEARDNCEEQVQIVEGLRYDYELGRSDFRLREEFGSNVIEATKNPHLAHCGVIVPGLNTGRLGLEVLDGNSVVVGRAALEVRSRKLSYRTDYQCMLEDITEQCVGLLMELRSPAAMRAAPDPDHSPETMHQRFAFLRGLIGSRSFRDALHRISTHPHQRWAPEEIVHDTRRGFKPSAKTQRQLVRASRWAPLPPGHPLKSRISSLPEQITIYKNVQTEDTPETRFVKFALQTFSVFLGKIRHKLEETANPSDVRLRASVTALENELDVVLAKDVFRDVSPPDILPLGSPVLQRKEGYREIYQAWLKFDMATRLVWKGGDDVYGAGQRDLATLYEYWVFFKLLAITTSVFQLERPAAKELIEETEDGFGLKLKSGRQLAFDGTFFGMGRPLRVRFSYNRSFGRNDEHRASGSWTERMRPDYTLSLWPAAFSENEAEAQELMVHIHFDAKYRIENVEQIFGQDDAELDSTERERDQNEEKLELRERRYKRSDLLKMHAYRDAIRHTQGAYILYPGDIPKTWERYAWNGYREILPGLGAFPLKPGDGEGQLESFIRKVVRHACDRATARERCSYHTYRVYKAPAAYQIFRNLPERDATTRARPMPPAETHVLVGWCKSEEHSEWISREKLYNFCMNTSMAVFRLTPQVSVAQYLLLHGVGAKIPTKLLRLSAEGPRIFSGDALKRQGYQDEPEGEFYLVFDVEPAPEFDGFSLNDAELPGRFPKAELFTVTLDALMAVVGANLGDSSASH